MIQRLRLPVRGCNIVTFLRADPMEVGSPGHEQGLHQAYPLIRVSNLALRWTTVLGHPINRARRKRQHPTRWIFCPTCSTSRTNSLSAHETSLRRSNIRSHPSRSPAWST